ncbi:MAG: response regulator [Anaerolineae bacterium]|nr:response regulator [Anaerolineae bacterium]
MRDKMQSNMVLVVEDNLPINKLFCKNLTSHGYICHGVISIEEAIHAIEQHQPDLLILDFELPDGYGIQILDYMNQEKKQIPAIVVSASNNVLELNHYQEYQINHILVKPVSPRLLAELVKQTLRH